MIIETLIGKNELSLKRWRRFKSNRFAMACLWLLGVFSFFSLTAEIWINNKPVVMKYSDKIYFPALIYYHPTEFGQEGFSQTDYRAISINDSDWAFWPLVRWSPFESNKNVDNFPSKPTSENIFGTDEAGRDVLARVVYGYRYSMGYAVGTWILAYLIGIAIGGIVGYRAGKWDLVFSRVVEVIEMMPVTLLLITLISIFSPSIWWLIGFSAAFEWTGMYHQMRAQFLQLRNREYVQAAKALGATHSRIVFSHILPNALTPVVTFSPFAIAANIYGLAILDYLGLGLQSPTPSWGELLSQAQKYFTTAQWLVWAPGLSLLITMVALINIGLAVRDSYDTLAVARIKA
jgi:microcin C transport system permease protein